MTMVDRVDAIRLGGWGWARGYELFWMDNAAADEPLSLLGLVIRTGEHVDLVNCGPDPSTVVASPSGDPMVTRQHIIEVKPGEGLVEALASVETMADDISHVIATPFQT